MGILQDGIKVAKGHWQTPFQMMFAAPKGQVNVNYQLNSSWEQHPFGTRNPKDWDGILKGTDPDGRPLRIRLAVAGGDGALNVDIGSREDPEIVGNMDIRTRGLQECFTLALQEWWSTFGEHHPKLHPSWYEEVEGYSEDLNSEEDAEFIDF